MDVNEFGINWQAEKYERKEVDMRKFVSPLQILIEKFLGTEAMASSTSC